MTAPYYEVGRDEIPPVRLHDGDQIRVSQIHNFLMLLVQPASDSSTALNLDPDEARQLIAALTEGIARIEAGNA